jgi:preprotein translocase subunit SecE
MSDEGATPAAAGADTPARKTRKQRTAPRQFLREVRSELRKVAWPSRKELISYSLVVLVSVTIITLYITGLDQVFGTLILRIFGS